MAGREQAMQRNWERQQERAADRLSAMPHIKVEDPEPERKKARLFMGDTIDGAMVVFDEYTPIGRVRFKSSSERRSEKQLQKACRAEARRAAEEAERVTKMRREWSNTVAQEGW